MRDTTKISRVPVLLFVLIQFVVLPQTFSVNIDSLQTLLETQQGEERIGTLLQLGNIYKKSDKEKSNVILKEAYLLSKDFDEAQSADIAYKIVRNYSGLFKNDSAVKYCSIALSIYRNNKDTLNIIKTSYIKGLSFQRLGEYRKSAKHHKAGIDLFAPYWKDHKGETGITKKHLAGMMTAFSNSLSFLGLYDSSLYYASESYNTHLEIGSSVKLIANALISIGNAYMMANRNGESIKYYVEAKDLYISLNDSVNIRTCFNNIGMANKRMGNKLEAIQNYEKAMEISKATKSKRGLATALINLSGLYIDNGETTKAENYLLEGLKAGKELGDKGIISTAYYNLSTLYMGLGNLEKALQYARNAEEVIAETEDLEILKDNILLLSDIYEKKGNYNLALKYHKEYKSVYDSMFNADNTERFNRLQTEFETSKKEQQIVLLTKDKENQQLENQILKNRQTTYVVVLILILALVGIIGFVVVMKRKKDRQIQYQKEILLNKEKELAKADLEKSKLKEKELLQSILLKSKQLSTHALHMMQKNTLLQEINSDIKAMAKNTANPDKVGFKQISLKVNQSLRSDKDWDVFKLYFEDVNRGFFNKLKEVNAGLTTNDQRLCALIKLNMTSKEMASVLNVAPVSVKSSRYRLKKKLGLDVEADLEGFIRDL
ncbi:MAG: hypothetical protein DRJ05_15495 [Bacteroidetes bacterium]|nr:MAG: hypothetical protein DRJ05_15495 [Bacteroidota bacterium]